jgi:hypothetical protein
MSKIKIDVPGWEAFDGYMGTLEFKQGVSVRDATPMEIARLGANIRITEVGNDEQVGPSTVMVNTRHVSAKLEAALETESNEQASQDAETGYTEDRLNEIADAGGIKALRKVAADFGVKGVSIAEMVKEILEAQKKAK